MRLLWQPESEMVVKHRECDGLLHGRIFPIELKGAMCKRYVSPVILYESEVWCLNESEMGMLRRTEGSMVIVMCGVQLKDRKRSTYLMLIFGFNEAIVGYGKQCSLVWSCVVERGWSCVVERGWSCVVERGWSCVERCIRF